MINFLTIDDEFKGLKRSCQSKKSNFLKALLLMLAMAVTATRLLAANYFVSSINGSDLYPGTFAMPFASLQKAANLTNPGDTVFAMNGTYSISPNNHDILKITRSGTMSQPIVYKNFPGHLPFIDFNVWNGIVVVNGTSYIVIDGFKVRGNNRNVTLTEALNQPSGCVNPMGSPSPLYNGNGIAVEGREAGGHCHHVTIRNCEVYESGSGGIGALECDYITVENNLVYNNSWYTRYGGSGISFLHSWNLDSNANAVKMIIRNNIVYGNQLLVPWRNGTVCEGITDGNGIIYDDNRNTQLGTAGTRYIGRALIENNISYRNGGRGIHSFLSDNVTIRNNTTFQNCKSAEIPDGEITVITGSNVQVYNNIMFARAGKRVSSATNTTNFLEDNNIMFNSPQRAFYNTHDIIADPKFADTASNDFRLLPVSSAINAGAIIAGAFSSTDIVGIIRPQGSLPDMGAYEFTGTPNTTGNFKGGNLALLRVGDGTNNLSTNAAAVDLLEYSTSGNPTGVQVILANALSATPKRLVLSGDNTSAEGQLHLSSDGRYLSLAGYEGSVGSPSNIYQANDKVIARVASNAVVDYATRLASNIFNRTVRCAVTENSSRFYITGTNASPASGNSTRFLPFGTPATTTSTAFNGGVRSIKMFKSQVYYANNNMVGSLTPDPSQGNYALNVPFSGMGLAGHNYQSFVLLDLNTTASFNGTGYDMLYCADQNLGLVKFYWNSSTWVFAGAFNPASTTGVTGGLQDITARITTAGNIEVFAVKGAAANNNIVTITDASGLTGNIASIIPTIENITSAGNHYMFRGVAFTPSEALIVLPIQLLSFKGSVLEDRVALNWATSTDINAREFVIEESLDGRMFSSIGSVAAKNSPQGGSYHFMAYTTGKQPAFYRLKMIDMDGSATFSNTIVINFQMQAGNKLKVFPNPALSYCAVAYPAASANASLSLFLVNGRKLGGYEILKGSTQTIIDLSKFAHGNYIIVYKNNHQTFTTTFIK